MVVDRGGPPSEDQGEDVGSPQRWSSWPRVDVRRGLTRWNRHGLGERIIWKVAAAVVITSYFSSTNCIKLITSQHKSPWYKNILLP